MMGRYRDIVGGSWEIKSVLAESVPHLLHQDLSYLWTLEQQPDQRPKTWASRIEAWKVLVQLFFLDQLMVEAEPLRKPLLDIAERFGIKRVTWLRHKASKQIVGVLSPTVIVRPLPDFVEDDLERWRAQMKDNDRDLRHLLYVAVKTLQRKADASPFAARIADILQREFSPEVAARRAPGGRDIEVPLLHRVTWERNDGDPPALTWLQLSVRSDDPEIPLYIPSCTTCGTLLLHEEGAQPIDVNDQIVKITCSNTLCANRDQQVPLSNFGIWLRNANVAVIWSPEQIPVMQDLGLPPPPLVSGSDVSFEWNSTTIGGERFRRFLHLRFVDRRIDVVQLMSIFFPKLLVPGDFESFNGSPVRPEWSDAIPRDRLPEVRAVGDQSRIEFRDLAVHGWPLRFTRHYTALSLTRAPELGVGLYPDPAVVGPGWRWFRAFTHGAAEGEYAVTCQGGTGVLPTLCATDNGLPESITIRSSSDPQSGVSYLPRRLAREDEYGEATVSMAVDFGTTNTIVYFQPPQRQHQRRLVPRAETHGLDPRKVAPHALWLADNGAWRKAESIAAFLPGPAYRQKAADPYIVPSEMWRVGQESVHLIRWTAVHPEGRNRPPLTHFKWDRDDMSEEGYTPTRLAYLTELVLLSLPVVIATFDPARVTAVRLGFAFPLAFEHVARTQFRQMLDTLAEHLSHLTGMTVTTGSSIDESRACVNAFGSFNGETFLVADMGGGTLDVALFSYEPDGAMTHHQMGSLRYAGERCIEALANALRVDDTNRIRDAVAAGESAKKYAKVEAERVITQFATIAFEFLRVMVAAYRTDEARRADPIKVVLVGNGWHLIEAFSTQARSLGSKRVYHDVYTDMIAAVDDPHLVFYDKAPLSEFPSSKHLIVAGALQNVTAQSTIDELSEPQVLFAKLPCGRAMTLAGKHQPWSVLVGEGVPLDVGRLDLASTSKAPLFVHLDDAPPPASRAWATRLENSLGADRGRLPYPTEGELLRELRDGISGSGEPRMKRGPLQIILELEWSSALTRPRGSVR